jgi:hypothetical protein
MIQPTVAMTAQLVDPESNGDVIRTITIELAGEPARVPLPPGRSLLLLVLQRP